MNRVILVALALVFSAPRAFPQDTHVPSGDSISVGGKLSLRTFRGCLSLSGDQYELTEGGAVPHQYRLLGSNLAQLDGKDGHMVSITGTMLEGSLPSAMNANAANGASDTINFLSVDDLSPTCGASGAMYPARETAYASAVAMTSAHEPRQALPPSVLFISMLESEAQPGSYMIVPLVGVLALGLLQTARCLRRS